MLGVSITRWHNEIADTIHSICCSDEHVAEASCTTRYEGSPWLVDFACPHGLNRQGLKDTIISLLIIDQDDLIVG